MTLARNSGPGKSCDYAAAFSSHIRIFLPILTLLTCRLLHVAWIMLVLPVHPHRHAICSTYNPLGRQMYF